MKILAGMSQHLGAAPFSQKSLMFFGTGLFPEVCSYKEFLKRGRSRAGHHADIQGSSG